MRVERVDLVAEALRKRRKKYPGESVTVIVGYTAGYAVHVHEMKMVNQGKPRSGDGSGRDKKTGRYKKGSKKGFFWDPQGRGQNKFLEQPFRENYVRLNKLVQEGIVSGLTMKQSLILAGTELQYLSQKLVPVDIGNLKASAFTRAI